MPRPSFASWVWVAGLLAFAYCLPTLASLAANRLEIESPTYHWRSIVNS